jgi:hypothetical protein
MALAADIPQLSNIRVANICHTNMASNPEKISRQQHTFHGMFFNENPRHD